MNSNPKDNILSVLVVGGAGFIGSHMVKMLGKKGLEVTTFDNLSTGHRDAVKCGEFFHGNLLDRANLSELFHKKKFDVVMHFASSINVGESVDKPAKYYKNNVVTTLNLLDVMREFNVKKFIFSSTAAIFGEPMYSPIDELHPKNPINPYGKSKLMVEQILQDYDHAYGLKSICLRYFNAAGASPEGDLAERHEPETHLIPLILRAASGRNKDISLFGQDYATKDGTCVRDYIHVDDLCSAHFLAIEHLFELNVSGSFNLGNGEGFSVKEVIESVEKITNTKLTVLNKPRRAGDPDKLIANSELAKTTLKWEAKDSNLDRIITDAWEVEKNFKRIQ
jgi:UDP-glucose 4-epimerase|tara:strand:- start:936 stop:1943 length:1008 start_codon:yes stop_codon:yes gene_type:complete